MERVLEQRERNRKREKKEKEVAQSETERDSALGKTTCDTHTKVLFTVCSC